MATPLDKHLCESIDVILAIAETPLSEYELIQQLNQQGWSLSTSATDTLALFTTHFLIYNSLYYLQGQYWQNNRYLEISALSIYLHKEPLIGTDTTAISRYQDEQALRDYYNDKTHLEEATKASVNQLIKDFWGRYIATDESTEAFAVFSLDPDTSYQEVKQRYRTLAMEHHPDRGGDAADFQRINWAFGVLQRVYNT